ncbi:polyphosphate kinase 1 [Paenibacillus yanchengensis]|uniref:Polyphosphate kinase n=1 Tax=Paenibacillus yanchengensis TaxID=2035833 RepID=A0ABW4YQA5_9BACL
MEMSNPQYLNRDLSWIEFNKRVLQEAKDPSTPLLERLKFLAIVSSNLDEFISVRLAGIQDQIRAGYAKKDFTGYTPSGLYKRLQSRIESIVAEQYRTYRDLMRQLAKEQIHMVNYDDLTIKQRKMMEQYYHEIIFPVLTPMAVDQSRPFPLMHTGYIYLAVVLQKATNHEEEDDFHFAILQIPSNLSRFISLPHQSNTKKQSFILIENVIRQHIDTLFHGFTPVAVNEFRLTRNADLLIDEEGAEDLLEEIEKELRKRRWGVPVRLEIEAGIHPYALSILQDEFHIEDCVYEIEGPLDMSYLGKLPSAIQGHSKLRYQQIEPIYPADFLENDDFFQVIRQKDVLVYHPYESFDAVTDFLMQAAEDPKVMAIKMTLYRVSGNSPVIKALAHAVEVGKQVTVVVELKARFDEERNIAWARMLEQAGCHVVYGLIGLKTHAKMLLVIRQEGTELKRYIHIGTGNYNGSTARLYTDIGLFTTDEAIGEDASHLFNLITGYAEIEQWQSIIPAPSLMKDSLFALIRREADHATNGRPAKIIAKMNSLSHQEMIDELYSASQAGVNIELIIRGICCLRPGIKGLSERITVRSIVDRFLEHTRIYYFENGGKPEIWISSADWMTRNLTRRLELMCPIKDPKLRKTMIHILHLSLRDNVKAKKLLPNGKYEQIVTDLPPCRSQFAALKMKSWKMSKSVL